MVNKLLISSLLLCLTHVHCYHNTFEDYDSTINNHPCRRPCKKNAKPMICKYNFTIEGYHTLTENCFDCPYTTADCLKPNCITADGNKRGVTVVNNQMPGPSIEVCLGDKIVVDVTNRLSGESTTIHWHGHHQKNTPYMDGVPGITQCPIPEGTTFRYIFNADYPGTHFWHSHSGFQRADGAYGAYIVRQSKQNNDYLYDYDLPSHTLIVSDWNVQPGWAKFLSFHHSDGENEPESLLINGIGRFKRFNSSINATVYTPSARFVVKRGFRYRFRLINAEYLNCPTEISVDNHTLTVISSDGHDIYPEKTETLVSYAGERFDFIINANQFTGLYWIRVRGLLDCDARFKSAHQVAVLQYRGASDTDYPKKEPTYEGGHKEGLQINSLNKPPGENNSLNVAELRAYDEWDDSLIDTPDYKFYVSFDYKRVPLETYPILDSLGNQKASETNLTVVIPQMDHISLKLLPVPLLPGRDQIDTNKFCNTTSLSNRNCTAEHCECTHVLQIKLNSVVELILIDEGVPYVSNHPFHLHGYFFRVVGMGKVGEQVTVEEVKKLDKQGKIKRNLINPPKKDTVTVPDGGYTVVRFHATNPGYWLFHCHLEFHMEVGMALVVKVGEHHEMLPVPENFPTCGNYKPAY